MKKYLLSLLVVWLTFIGFSSADLVLSCTNWTNWTCTNIDFTAWYNNYNKCVNLPDDVSQILLTPSNCNNNSFEMNWPWGDTDWHSPYSCDQTYDITNMSVLCIWDSKWDFTLKYIYPPLLSWGSSNFTPVLTSISSSISEFIPYIVYIGLWILGALIWFYAIRWFINWLRKKIFSSFK